MVQPPQKGARVRRIRTMPAAEGETGAKPGRNGAAVPADFTVRYKDVADLSLISMISRYDLSFTAIQANTQ
ncbi:MAG: hypothetical protein BGP04_06070 [Rhizobiales bacterium 62-17]|nr:MAG: hypothetical protein BGP04_06070 [Rhizobiales bacterium 62-17]